MNYFNLGDTILNLDQIQYITIEERDEEGSPILAKVHFAPVSSTSTFSQVVIAETLIQDLFRAINLEKESLPA